MADRSDLTCYACGYQGFTDGRDGYFYCDRCGSQAEDVVDTAVDEEDLFGAGEDGGGGIYLSRHSRQLPSAPIKAEPISQSQPQSQFWESLEAEDGVFSAKTEEYLTGDGVGPTGPSDFVSGSKTMDDEELYYTEIRARYVMGIQFMIQMQCEALVKKHKVSKVILGLAGTFWLRFLYSTGVFDDDWAYEAINESESQNEEQREFGRLRTQYGREPTNSYNQRAVMIWYRSLSNKIPLSHSLAITYLACHVAREAVLPTDISKWLLEGTLPYIAAFVEIEKKFNKIGPPSVACPLSASFMFKPSEGISLRKLESQAASIAQTIGLQLPPVNFYAIALRYLRKLSLPAEKILPSICRIYEWSLPPELWLSANDLRLPTRVGVMSLVIVAIRMLYNIHGLGIWEKSLSTHSGLTSRSGHDEPTGDADARDADAKGLESPVLDGSSPGFSNNTSHAERSELDAVELLHSLDARYSELQRTYEYGKDLSTYLHYCNEVVFAGLGVEDFAEEKIINELWDHYETNKDAAPSSNQETKSNGGFHEKKSTDEVASLGNDCEERSDKRPMHFSQAGAANSDGGNAKRMGLDNCSTSNTDSVTGGPTSSVSYKEKAIRQMKENMEENRFCYIPPRVNIKRLDYLHYVRKIDEGAYTYAAHADYYILLRACARVAQVDIRVMHVGVLSFERRLGWLEKRIDHCLNMNPQKSGNCDFCRNEMTENADDDSINLTELS